MPQTRVLEGRSRRLALGFIDRWFRPSYLLLASQRSVPTWVGWFAWGLTALATLAYVLVDVVAWRR